MPGKYLSRGEARIFFHPTGEPENPISEHGGEKRSRDEQVVRYAEVLYAGARKGFFNLEESIEYLQGCEESLQAVLKGKSRVKRKAEMIQKSILKYLDGAQERGSLELCFERQSEVPNKMARLGRYIDHRISRPGEKKGNTG